MRIGLLGGSFNPVHDGHRHITLAALGLLRLDRVWWMVSPQNPLKPAADMAPYAERLTAAANFARHPRIEVSDIEARLGTRYTVDTLGALERRNPFTRFVWLMGADNLIEIPRWRDWTGIFARVPIAIFNRNSYSFKALAGTAARRYRSGRLHAKAAPELAERTPPAWVYLPIVAHGAAGTEIRAGGKRQS
ncbi:MAG: nicotinate-nucleotide adenylyltransferase [Alphaproteobacteria bacterium]|nr:MAG: nicotinate-nucleotide adenylyltransferase [Alphaproteobacteria bacterium]